MRTESISSNCSGPRLVDRPHLVGRDRTLLLGALLLPRIAEAIGRFGPRAVFLAGLGITTAALMLLPSVTEPWQLVVLYIVMAPGWNATSVAPSPPRSASGSTASAASPSISR